ncbi:MAG: hypothetical protein ABIG44_03005, partial [Planctomycetota bacterium]
MLTNQCIHRALALTFVCLMIAGTAWATVDFIEHHPDNQVYGEPAGMTMRTPPVPRQDEPVDIWIRIGYSFYYDNVAIYYTTDGSEPQGAFGVPSGTTAVLTHTGGGITFIRNEPLTPNNIDWWQATLPPETRAFGDTIRYKISAWHSGGGAEVFANNYGCSDGECDDPAAPATEFEYTVKLAWPGKGNPYPDHDVGYPPVSFWKEEAVVGNNYVNVMLDQNGTVYDVYYPSAGCVQGLGTKNEGYSDGLDTFPPGLPVDHRGQMNINQAMGGIRVGGRTYWLSNEDANGYSAVSQEYIADTNVVHSTATLTADGRNILIQQYDFAPLGITFPTDQGGQPNRGIYIKRYILTNNGPTTETVDFYFYCEHALNGGDSYDGTFTDAARGAVVAYDNTYRLTSSSGEYNPTSFGDYEKDVSVYLAVGMKQLAAVGGAGGQVATDFWNDTSSDQGLGWSGLQLTLAPGASREIDVAFVGGFDDSAGAADTYVYQIAGVLDWFIAGNMSNVQAATEAYWTDWLNAGVTIDCPDDRYDQTFKRSLLATALHLDGEGGGIIAGMHNGAYPFVWPRDAAWAAITLARAGHVVEAEHIFEFLRDVAYRDMEGWGRPGFWKQKYTTDGYTVWSAPQVDETSCYPWGVRYIYDVTGELQFLADHYDEVYEAAIASSQDSTFDTRMYYDEAYDLMYSNNLWEDSWDLFVYSNASVIRGLEDAAAIATVLDEQWCPGGPGNCNYHNDAALFTQRANDIRGGLDARLAWDGENCDISQVGIAYPFAIYPAGHGRVEHILDRINGVATDTFGNNHPLVNFGGEWDGLVNRYWGDTYWNNPAAPNPNGSPWFLTTLWYGCYYAERQDLSAGTGDIDNHKYRLDLLLDRLGPIGLGAEQIAPENSLSYPGQTDFLLQAAWPNAWESMSFLADAMLLMLDYTPDAPGNTLRIAPKLPSAWESMTFNNVPVADKRLDITCELGTVAATHTFVNVTGTALAYETYIRIPADKEPAAVT